MADWRTMMATGDPLYCFEHKCFQMACAMLHHVWESEEDYERRTAVYSVEPHNCPYCRCVGYGHPDLDPLRSLIGS